MGIAGYCSKSCVSSSERSQGAQNPVLEEYTLPLNYGILGNNHGQGRTKNTSDVRC